MAPPVGWSKNSDGSYTSPIVSSGGVKTKLVTNLNGNQKITNESGTVIFERNLGDTKWNTKNNDLAKQITDSSDVQTIANGSSYRLIQSEGSTDQKNKANSSESFKSNKNKIFDNSKFKEEAYQEEPPANPGQVAKGGGRFQYPVTMTDAQDKIRFTAVEIVPGEKSTYVQKDTSIYIAVQAPIQDTNTVKWGESSQNAIQEGGLELARAIGNADASAVAKSTQQYAEYVKATNAEFAEYSLGQAVGVPDAFTRSTKKVLNPNLELLFQGPQLRSFQMSFKMSARDAGEAAIVKGMIRYFKYHMSVRKDGSGIFLKSPHVFTIQYLKGVNIHQSIGLISPKVSGKTRAAALLSCNVDYTPLGTYITFDDEEATMVSYTINLQFQEIEVVYNTDYLEGEGAKHSIGY
jgi:hypothetical protein